MQAVTRLDPGDREALVEHVGRVKHDLGKYVAFQVRWLPPGAPEEERRQALASDLLATRRGPEGEQDAESLWRSFRPVLVGDEPLPGGSRIDLSGDAAVQEIDRAMAVVAEVAGALRDGRAGAEEIERGTAAALAVAEAARDLNRRMRGA